MTNVFTEKGTSEFINRIHNLTPETKPQWGKMSVEKMLAHCNVTYELIYEDKHPRPKGLKKLLIKLLIKNYVVGDKPFKKNGGTAPAFLIRDERKFKTEKDRLIQHLEKTQQLGEPHFNGKESHSFGPLTIKEWNTMFSKHLDHHLTQFGV
jgi:hypothetical protein